MSKSYFSSQSNDILNRIIADKIPIMYTYKWTFVDFIVTLNEYRNFLKISYAILRGIIYTKSLEKYSWFKIPFLSKNVTKISKIKGIYRKCCSFLTTDPRHPFSNIREVKEIIFCFSTFFSLSLQGLQLVSSFPPKTSQIPESLN